MIDSNEPNGKEINGTGNTARMNRSRNRIREENLEEEREIKLWRGKKTRKETVVGNI